MSDKNNDSCYPYTYACDLIRQKGPIGANGLSVSRADASQIRKLFSEVLKMDDHEIACKLADYYLKNEDDLTEQGVQRLLHSSAMR